MGARLGAVGVALGVGTCSGCFGGAWEGCRQGAQVVAEGAQAAARALPLEWQQPGGAWVAITERQASRTTWGPDARFVEVTWEPLADGMALAELPLRRVQGGDFPLVMVRLDPQRWPVSIGLAGEGSAKASAAAIAEEEGMILAVNAAYFSTEGVLGLVLHQGQVQQRQGTKRPAHFLVDPSGRVRIVNQRKASLGAAVEGFQGFPSIMDDGITYSYLRDGHKSFDVFAVDRRTAACTLSDGQLVLAVTDTLTGGVSLAELATLFGGLGCRDAMGFDGGTSTGLVLRLPDHHRTVPTLKDVPMVVGVRAPASKAR